MHFRKDIQILRGLAVLFVVMFHLQVPGFRAGFLAVDILFVISGYLMGVLYYPAKKSNFWPSETWIPGLSNRSGILSPGLQNARGDGRPYYFDDARLTTTGSEQLRPVFE